MLVLIDDGRGCPRAAKVSPWARVRSRLQASRLDSALAHGAPPDAAVGLTLRAQALMTMPVRRQVAAGLTRVLGAAAEEPAAARLAAPVCRERVREHSAELRLLVDGLLVGRPVGARGVAMARMLLCDASSPLYHRACTEDLSRKIHSAVDALRPQ